MTRPISVLDALNANDLRRAVDLAKAAVTTYNATANGETIFSLPYNPRLIGLDPAVYHQIEAAVRADKRHVMLYGPPGTGKTELARYLAARLTSKTYVLVTGSADWSSQDLIGGYQPLGEGKIGFVPGILLRNFDRPFIIDEMNRCDIDKVLGPLFTVLSKGSTTLPYRVDVADPVSAQYQILGLYQPEAPAHVFSPAPDWRIIATINTVDKSSLYQMSYALSRRFAWVFVQCCPVKSIVSSEKPSICKGLRPIWRAVDLK